MVSASAVISTAGRNLLQKNLNLLFDEDSSYRRNDGTMKNRH
jgi:hypothetical protein